MRQQTKPFIIEIKSSRRMKSDQQKTSIWGTLDLTLEPDPRPEPIPAEQAAAVQVKAD